MGHEPAPRAIFVSGSFRGVQAACESLDEPGPRPAGRGCKLNDSEAGGNQRVDVRGLSRRITGRFTMPMI